MHLFQDFRNKSIRFVKTKVRVFFFPKRVTDFYMRLLFFLSDQLPQPQSHKLRSLQNKNIIFFSIITNSCILASHSHFDL